VRAPLNLARRPFRNERLPTLVLAAACLAIAVTTARHALLARDLLPGRARDVESEVVAIEKEIETLRAQSAELREVAASPDALKEWAAVKGLVDRRMFSWTGLLAALEKALPPGVRIVSIAPQEEAGRTELALSAVGRTSEDALALLQALQSHEEFDGAFLKGWGEGRDGVDIQCTVRYAPKARPGAGSLRKADPAPGASPLRKADPLPGTGR
jgi:Tfp pilus assembly protein PilN